MPLIGSYFCFVAVFLLITPYAIIMKIASIAKPTGYSGMEEAGSIVKFTQPDAGTPGFVMSTAWALYDPRIIIGDNAPTEGARDTVSGYDNKAVCKHRTPRT